MNDKNTPVPIGIFDSGVGGLSVLRSVRQFLPSHPVIYLADQAHVPYGARTRDEVRAYSQAITRFLLDQGVELVIVACNTASAAALYYLREVFPDTPFVGMEPAVKPAAETTHSGVIGVLATPVTFQGELYASVVERFAAGVTVLQDACPGLVKQIEAGDLDGDETRNILERALHPMMHNGVDTVVMGCTHNPFVIPLIQEIVGAQVRGIDPDRPRPSGSAPDQSGAVIARLAQRWQSICPGALLDHWRLCKYGSFAPQAAGRITSGAASYVEGWKRDRIVNGMLGICEAHHQHPISLSIPANAKDQAGNLA